MGTGSGSEVGSRAGVEGGAGRARETTGERSGKMGGRTAIVVLWMGLVVVMVVVLLGGRGVGLVVLVRIFTCYHVKSWPLSVVYVCRGHKI